MKVSTSPRTKRNANDGSWKLSDIDPTPEAKLFWEVVLFPVVLRADIRRAMGGYNGWAGDFSAYMPIAGWKIPASSPPGFSFGAPGLCVGDRETRTER